LRRRRTWATTGERNVAYLTCGSAVQGDELEARWTVPLHYRLFGQRGWELVTLADQRGVIWQRDLHHELGHAPERLRLRWGGARVKDRYRWATWKLDVAVLGSAVTSWTARGFEHPEERARLAAHGRFEIDSATHGDADELELRLDNPDSALLIVRATIAAFDGATSPPVVWEVPAREVLQGSGAARRELGGVDLFLAVERVTARTLPLVLSGEIVVPVAEDGPEERAVYLFARELGDAKVWTSPLFIRRAA